MSSKNRLHKNNNRQTQAEQNMKTPVTIQKIGLIMVSDHIESRDKIPNIFFPLFLGR